MSLNALVDIANEQKQEHVEQTMSSASLLDQLQALMVERESVQAYLENARVRAQHADHMVSECQENKLIYAQRKFFFKWTFS